MRIAALAVVLLAALGMLYLVGRGVGATDYLEDLGRMRHWRQLEARWDADMLRARIDPNINYDSMVGGIHALQALLGSLDEELARRGHHGRDPVGAASAALRAALADKSPRVERFKSANALLRNSLLALPAMAAEVQVAVPHAEQDVSALLLGTLLFSQLPESEARALVESRVLAVKRHLRTVRPAEATRIDMLLTHVAVVLKQRVAVDQLAADIGGAPTLARADDLTQALNVRYSRSLARSALVQLGLLAFAALLVGIVIYAAAKLFRQHELLRESRDALARHGNLLEQKIAERVEALKQSEARMAQLAQYDELTGLPNRNLFRDRLSHALARANRSSEPMALLFIDLDHFKQINDSLGHDAGDALLKVVGQRLREALRDVDTIARLSGDEFTVIIERIHDNGDAEVVARKVNAALSLPVRVAERELAISASVGVALYPSDASDAEGLLRAADIAMYRAKESGRNAHAVFRTEMAARVAHRAEIAAALRQAIEREELALAYQPQLDLRTGAIVRVEALLRWTHPKLGSVPPAQFIPIAEETGLIVPIGEWVLRSACLQGSEWARTGLGLMSLAINLSPRQLRERSMVDRISAILEETAFPAHQLELELTEGVIMEDVKAHAETLAAIRRLGARIAVDDFGTGYSSLAYLSRLPIQTLKIDRSFIGPMVDDASALMLVSTMITLAHSLRLEVVAEGVECDDQKRALQQMGCDYVQGYHLSAPLAPAALSAFVSRARDRSVASAATAVNV